MPAGTSTITVKDALQATWLPDGSALVEMEDEHTRIWHPGDRSLGRPLPFLAPKRSVTQIDDTIATETWGKPDVLAVRDLDGKVVRRFALPLTDNEGATAENGIKRNYRQGHTIDGTTFLPWHDINEHDDEEPEIDTDYGVLVLGPDGKPRGNVLVDDGVIATWLAADGSAMLATKRPHGDPCGGCNVTQQLAELDPKTGETIATYDFPDAYTKDWDVREVDKVGDKVVVRFEQQVFRGEEGPQVMLQRGTWVLDGDGWTMVPGSDRERSWWQGPHDRVVAVPVKGSNGYRSRYFWEHDGKRTPLPGASESAPLPNQPHYYNGSAPGQLIAP